MDNKENKKELIIKNIKVLAIKIVFIVLLFYFMFFVFFGVTRMNDLSMKPTIPVGDLVIYYRLDKHYEVGDVVTFVKDGKRYVSRIIATENQVLNLNNKNEFSTTPVTEQPQTYFETIIPEDSTIQYPYKVGSKQVFVVGDYRIETDDSRTFGTIDINSIDGKVIGILQTKDI